MVDVNNLLPIGSVVLLKDGTKKVMITGFCVKVQDQDKIYDYCGCLYPEGIISSEQNLVFDHSQIVKLIHKGYLDDEEKQFKEKLAEIVKNS